MHTCLICHENCESTHISLKNYYKCSCLATCHVKCLDEWSSVSGKCILCRKPLETYSKISATTAVISGYWFYPEGNISPSYFTSLPESSSLILSLIVFLTMTLARNYTNKYVYRCVFFIFKRICIEDSDFEYFP